jgi:hypothetical protein
MYLSDEGEGEVAQPADLQRRTGQEAPLVRQPVLWVEVQSRG